MLCGIWLYESLQFADIVVSSCLSSNQYRNGLDCLAIIIFFKLLLGKLHKTGRKLCPCYLQCHLKEASGPRRCVGFILISEHMNFSTSSFSSAQALWAVSWWEFGFLCRFHHREEYTEQYSGCYISVMNLNYVFFFFFAFEKLILPRIFKFWSLYKQRPIFALGCLLLWGLLAANQPKFS